MLNHNRNNTVKIRLKNDSTTLARLGRDGVPLFIIEELVGRDIPVVECGEPYTVQAAYKGKASLWSIAPECVMVTEF